MCGSKVWRVQVLPQRIQEWSLSSCVAEQQNRKALEVVRGGLARAQAALRALDAQHRDLDALRDRALSATILHSDDKVPQLFIFDVITSYRRVNRFVT